MGSSLGKEITVGETKLRIKDLLYERDRWHIYLSQDVYDPNISYDLHIATIQDGDTETETLVLRDMEIWKHFPVHSNLAKYIDSCIVQDGNIKRAIIVTEHYDGGNLENYVQNLYPQRLNEKAILAIIRDVACAITILHEQKPSVTHRVLIPSNIFFDNSGAYYKCKLAPSSLLGSESITPSSIEGISSLEKVIDRVLDPGYAPPELYNIYKLRKITDKVDIWELGILSYFLAFYTTPFVGDNGLVKSDSLEEGRITFVDEYASQFSIEFLDFIKYMLVPDFKKRPSIRQVLDKLATIPRFKPSKEYLELTAKPVKPTPISNKNTDNTERGTDNKKPQVKKTPREGKSLKAKDITPPLPDRNESSTRVLSNKPSASTRKSNKQGSLSPIPSVSPSTPTPKENSKGITKQNTIEKKDTKEKEKGKTKEIKKEVNRNSAKLVSPAGKNSIKNQNGKVSPTTTSTPSKIEKKKEKEVVEEIEEEENDYESNEDASSDGTSLSDMEDEYANGIKREKGETMDILKAKMLHYFGGKHNYGRWVFKCTSKVPEPPHMNYLRKIILEAWETKSIDFFYKELQKRPLLTSEIVAVKALTAVLRIHQLGSQDILEGSIENIHIFEEMNKKWGIIEDDVELSECYNWAPFISRFASIIVTKLRFHYQHKQFDFRYQVTNEDTIDTEERVNIASRMTTFMVSLDLAERWALANTDPVIIGCIRPLIDESYAIYESVTSIIKSLIRPQDEDIIITEVRNRYEEARQNFSIICLRAKQIQELSLFDMIPTISEVSPLQAPPKNQYESRISLLETLETMRSVENIGGEEEEEDDDDSNITLLGLLYKQTANGKIKPLVGANWLMEKGEQLLPSLKRIIAIKGNNKCCECNRSIDSSKASINLGIFLCNRCATLHTQLPEGISVVKKLKTEDLLPLWIAILADIGNRKANRFWEFDLPTGIKPQEDDSDEKWLTFFEYKYVQKRWIHSNTKTIEEKDSPMDVLSPKTLQTELRETNESVDVVDLFEDTAQNIKREESISDVFNNLEIPTPTPQSSYLPYNNMSMSTRPMIQVNGHPVYSQNIQNQSILSTTAAPPSNMPTQNMNLYNQSMLNRQNMMVGNRNPLGSPLLSGLQNPLSPSMPMMNPSVSPTPSLSLPPQVPPMTNMSMSSYYNIPNNNYYNMNTNNMNTMNTMNMNTMNMSNMNMNTMNMNTMNNMPMSRSMYNPLYSNMQSIPQSSMYPGTTPSQPPYNPQYMMNTQNPRGATMQPIQSSLLNITGPSPIPSSSSIQSNTIGLLSPSMKPNPSTLSPMAMNAMPSMDISSAPTSPIPTTTTTTTTTNTTNTTSTSSTTTNNYVPPTISSVMMNQQQSTQGSFQAFSQDNENSVNAPLQTPGKSVQPVQVSGSTTSSKKSILTEDTSEDEDDYETRVEKLERRQDEAVKKKVMSALQTALSDIQLTGIQIEFEELEILDRIGVGGFAIVYRGFYRGTEVAVKKLRVSRMSAKAIRDFHSEVFIMKTLRHPNIVIFMGLVMEPVCLVTEFCQKGNLFDLLHDVDVYSSESEEENEEEHYHYDIPWTRRIRIACDVARGMNFLHTSSPVIIHRDLKTLNILVDEKWTAKVSDFGLSRFKSVAGSLMTGQCGTYQWMAPEVIGGHVYTEKADVFSFGVILWEMFTRKVPYEGMQPMQVAVMVHTNKKRLPIPSNCPEWYADLIRDCWAPDPETRPNFADILRRLRKAGPVPTNYV